MAMRLPGAEIRIQQRELAVDRRGAPVHAVGAGDLQRHTRRGHDVVNAFLQPCLAQKIANGTRDLAVVVLARDLFAGIGFEVTDVVGRHAPAAGIVFADRARQRGIIVHHQQYPVRRLDRCRGRGTARGEGDHEGEDQQRRRSRKTRDRSWYHRLILAARACGEDTSRSVAEVGW